MTWDGARRPIPGALLVSCLIGLRERDIEHAVKRYGYQVASIWYPTAVPFWGHVAGARAMAGTVECHAVAARARRLVMTSPRPRRPPLTRCLQNARLLCATQ